ncbi:putative methyltransferase [archaeon]|nr:putative methyltransferase [archaeon]
MYISHIVDVCIEIYRALKDEGSFYLNIDDSYYSHRSRANKGVKRKVVKEEKYLQPKQLLGIPFRVMIELQNRGFILRNIIIWHKPNHMPSSVKDRRSTTWEPVFHFVKSQKYDFDLDAIRISHKGTGGGPGFGAKVIEQNRNYNQREHPLGKNPGDILTIPTKGSPEAHYAVFPEALITKLLKPHARKICKKCGLPKKKILEAVLAQNSAEVKRSILKKMGQLERVVGYEECDCEAGYRNKIVLDPFAGRGTVGKVAKELGMDYLLFDIDPKNVEIAKRYINRSELPNYRKLERKRNAIVLPYDLRMNSQKTLEL